MNIKVSLILYLIVFAHFASAFEIPGVFKCDSNLCDGAVTAVGVGIGAGLTFTGIGIGVGIASAITKVGAVASIAKITGASVGAAGGGSVAKALLYKTMPESSTTITNYYDGVSSYVSNLISHVNKFKKPFFL